MTEQPIETKENRQTVVVSVDLFPNDPNSPMSFGSTAKNLGIESDEFWIVVLVMRDGSLPEGTSVKIFENEQKAREFVDANPVGSIRQDSENTAERVKVIRGSDLLEQMFDKASPPTNFFKAGDEEGYLVWKTLKDGGINDGYRTSPKVLEFLGAARIEKFKSIHGENWTVAAEMEFCFLTLPCSSSAYVAAQQKYNYYIVGDDFSAGYLLRDLEMLVHGVERAAQRANEFSERQAARAAKGGEAIAQKAELRRTTFFRLALSNVSSWIWKSETEQRRFLKKLSTEHDKSTGDDLFKHGSKTLSDHWFDEMLSSLRQSGELEAVMSGKALGPS